MARRRPRAVERRAEVASGVQAGQRQHVVGAVEVGRCDTNTVPTPAVGQGAVPVPLLGHRARRACVAAYVAAGVRPRSRSTRAQTSSRSRPTTGRSSTVTATSSWVATDGVAVARAAPRACGRALEVRGEVAAVAEPGRDPQRAPLAAAADDDRDPAGRAGVAGRLGQADPLAVVRLGAGRPQRPHRLDRRPRARRAARAAGGNGRPYAACSRSHQPAPTPTNARPPVSASRVAAAFAVIAGAAGR